MEFNEGRAAAEKNIEDPGALHEHRTADILARYLTGTETDAEAGALLAASCNQPWALVGIGMSPRRGQADAQEIRRVINNAPIECAIAEIDDIAIVLVSYAEIRHLIEGALDKGKIGKLPICVSLPFESLAAIPQQYDLVTYCLNERPGAGVYDARQSALPYLKSKITSSLDIDSLLHPALQTLAQYDASNRSNLLNTLQVYLENDRNAQQCANKLYLHRNSLQYRVRRIQEIANIDLDDERERAYLRLSFLLKS